VHNTEIHNTCWPACRHDETHSVCVSVIYTAMWVFMSIILTDAWQQASQLKVQPLFIFNPWIIRKRIIQDLWIITSTRYFQSITRLDVHCKNILEIVSSSENAFFSQPALQTSPPRHAQGQRGNGFTVLLVCVLCFWGNREITTAARALGAAGDGR